MTTELNEIYWNTRYLNFDSGWDVGFITTPIKNYIDQLEDKSIKILIPGAGNSYEAEYLFQNGFNNVFVCDFAESPLKNLKNRVPQFPVKQLIQEDFFNLEQNNFDLIIEQTFFCAIKPSLRQNYFNKMHELLKPGGKLVGVLFNDVLNNDKPPFGGNQIQYYSYFKNIFYIKTFETCYNSILPRAGREIFINLQKPE
jgi:thiopurine S-methyltransferase